MISISTQMEQKLQPVQLREDEYLEEKSKLVYCGKCGTPRQKRRKEREIMRQKQDQKPKKRDYER